MGLVQASGSVTWNNTQLVGKKAFEIGRLGLGYVLHAGLINDVMGRGAGRLRRCTRCRCLAKPSRWHGPWNVPCASARA